MSEKHENYYEVLRVSRTASISEIVAAYHSARAAFSKDSIAMYSLFSQDEADKVIAKLEEAYLTLSNIEKKREYDRLLSGGAEPQPPIRSMRPTPASPTLQSGPDLNAPAPVISFPLNKEEATDPNLPQPEAITGVFLKNIRERRSLSLEDVSRITKIPIKFLDAIENENIQALPAKVYVQGFIKNLSSLYKLNPDQTARMFTSLIESKKTGT